MPDAKICELLGKVFAFVEDHPDDGIERLKAFLETGDKLLFSTEDVMELTGWSRAHIIRLCNRGDLPHIPGNPHKFMYQPLVESLHKLMVGGEYGRRKCRIKPKRTLKRKENDL